MPDGLLSITTKAHPLQEFRALARRLRAAGRGDLQRRLTNEVRKVGAPAHRAARAAWMGVDVTPPAGHTGQSTGLRARVRDATKLSATQRGIRIYVDTGEVDPNHGLTLALGLNGRMWAHPLFGNRRHWYRERGQEVFYSTLNRFEPTWRAGIESAMEEVAREIEG